MTVCDFEECQMLDVIDDLRVRVGTLEKNVGAEAERTRAAISGMNTKMDGIDKKLDRVIEGLEFGVIVPTSPNKDGNGKDHRNSLLSWDRSEDTGLHAAPTWATRARETASTLEAIDAERERLAIENAALRAAATERSRISQRRRLDTKEQGEFTIKKWQIVAGLITAILGSGVVTALVSWLATK